MAADISQTIVKTIKVAVYLAYQGKVLPYYTHTLPLNQESEGAGVPITDFKEACRVINEEISPLLKGKDILGLKKIDDILQSFQKKKKEDVNDNIIRACSEAVLFAYPQCTSPSAPY